MAKILPKLAPKAILVLRNYLHVPESLDLSEFKEISQIYAQEIANEKIQMYDVRVYQAEIKT